MSTIPPLATSPDRDLPAPALRRRPWLLRGFDLRMWDARTWDARTWRNNLRLTSALVLLSFVICHLLAHSLLIVSFDAADAVFDVTMYVWQTKIGTGTATGRLLCPLRQRAVVDLCAAVTAACALAMDASGDSAFSIPLLLMSHVMGTGSPTTRWASSAATNPC